MSKNLDDNMKKAMEHIDVIDGFQYFQSGVFNYAGKKYNMIIEEVSHRS